MYILLRGHYSIYQYKLHISTSDLSLQITMHNHPSSAFVHSALTASVFRSSVWRMNATTSTSIPQNSIKPQLHQRQFLPSTNTLFHLPQSPSSSPKCRVLLAMDIRPLQPSDIPHVQQANITNLPENYFCKYYMYHALTWPQLSYVAVDVSNTAFFFWFVICAGGV